MSDRANLIFVICLGLAFWLLDGPLLLIVATCRGCFATRSKSSGREFRSPLIERQKLAGTRIESYPGGELSAFAKYDDPVTVYLWLTDKVRVAIAACRGWDVHRLGFALLALALGGCAASREEVAARLGAEYVGKNVDTVVAKFGPPTSMFKMNSGQTSYQWQLANQTEVAVDDYGYGSASRASTQYCKVNVIASPTGVVSQLNTEDSNAGSGIDAAVAYGSICALTGLECSGSNSPKAALGRRQKVA